MFEDKSAQQQMPPAIFLMGPTASGKTQIALELIKHLPLEIISVDSALVYRGMDIGTAKPDKTTLQHIPHHLIDIRDPAQSYSAAEFRHDALCVMADITARGKIPLLVGGTMLYFKSLLQGLAELPGTDPDIRAHIVAEAAQIGWPAMHSKLMAIDPDTASRLHPNHSQRIGRALEVFLMSGETMSALRAKQTTDALPYRTLQLAIAPKERDILYKRIEKRFYEMMHSGFMEEMETLYQRGDLTPELPSMRAVGYRQAWQYLAQRQPHDDKLSGSLTREQMIEHAMIATRQLAKRQFTWLRSWQDLQWVYFDLAPNADPVAFAHCLESTVADVRQRVEDFICKE